jgi:hypothetical protein
MLVRMGRGGRDLQDLISEVPFNLRGLAGGKSRMDVGGRELFGS